MAAHTTEETRTMETDAPTAHTVRAAAAKVQKTEKEMNTVVLCRKMNTEEVLPNTAILQADHREAIPQATLHTATAAVTGIMTITIHAAKPPKTGSVMNTDASLLKMTTANTKAGTAAVIVRMAVMMAVKKTVKTRNVMSMGVSPVKMTTTNMNMKVPANVMAEAITADVPALHPEAAPVQDARVPVHLPDAHTAPLPAPDAHIAPLLAAPDVHTAPLLAAPEAPAVQTVLPDAAAPATRADARPVHQAAAEAVRPVHRAVAEIHQAAVLAEAAQAAQPAAARVQATNQAL